MLASWGPIFACHGPEALLREPQLGTSSKYVAAHVKAEDEDQHRPPLLGIIC